MPNTVSRQRLAQEVEDRTLLLASGFNHRQDALDKAATMIRLRTMRSTPSDHGIRR